MVAMFTLDQDSFRGRNDDDTEVAATWITASNTDWTQAVDANFRIRFLMEETDNDQGTLSPQIQMNHNSSGFVDLATDVVFASSSIHFAHNDATTSQLSNGTFTAGNMGEDTGTTADINMGTLEETEVEFCLQISGVDVNDGDTILFRIINGNTAVGSYTNTPTVTASKGAGPAEGAELMMDHYLRQMVR